MTLPNELQLPQAALDDLRVLEVTDENGQHCGKLLADMGAHVIRVEPPGGCAERRVGPFYQDLPGPDRSLFFWHYNTNKRGITLNLDAPGGQQIFRDLARKADVVLESLAPGRMAARGLGYRELREIIPRLIYCSVTPYGQDGPYAHYKATELALMASGGQMGVCGYDRADDPDETPIAPGGGNAWHIGSHYAYIALLAALYARDLRGIGQYLDVSIQESIAVCTEGAFPDHEYLGQDRRRQTGRHASITPTPRTQHLCQDGRYLNAFIPRLKMEEWLDLVAWLDSEGMADDLGDVRYLDPDEQQKAMPHIYEVIGRFAAAHTADYMFHEGQKRKFAWTIVRAPSDLLEDEHLRHRRFFVDVPHPELGRSFTYPGAPYLFHGTPWRIRRRAPLLGEDNLAVYGQELGIPLDRINALREAGVI